MMNFTSCLHCAVVFDLEILEVKTRRIPSEDGGYRKKQWSECPVCEEQFEVLVVDFDKEGNPE